MGSIGVRLFVVVVTCYVAALCVHGWCGRFCNWLRLLFAPHGFRLCFGIVVYVYIYIDL